MFALIEQDGDYESSWVIGVTVFTRINTRKEYNALLREWTDLKNKADNLRRKRKLKSTEAGGVNNNVLIMKELGYPENFEEFLKNNSITSEKVEFELE